MKRILCTFVATTALVLASLAIDGPASARGTLPVGSSAAPAAAQPLTSADWQRLSRDAFGNRQQHGWTITPDGSQVRARAVASDCASGRTCLFQNSGYTGWIQSYVGPGTANLLGVYDDNMSSWINRNPLYASWYTGADTFGTGHCMPPNVQVSAVSSSENDTASSLKIFKTGVTC